MRYKEYKWVDVAYGGAEKRNNVVPVSKVKKPKNTPDCYRTVYRYPDEFKQHFDKNKTVSGYNGPVYSDFLPIDIDDDNNLDNAQKVAVNAVKKLEATADVQLEYIWLYFSGSKGFHILLPAEMLGVEPSKHLPDHFKFMVSRMFPDLDIDLSIYDKLRLFRISNTKHGKTGLYKVQLRPNEILYKNIGEIKELAKKPRDATCEPPEEKNDVLVQLYNQFDPKKHGSSAKPEKSDQGSLSETKPPKRAKRCYYKLLQGVDQGERDNAALRLAVHFKKQGYGRDIILGIMERWNRKNRPPLQGKDVEKAVSQAYENSYDFGCNDHLLEACCDPRCYINRSGKKRESSDLTDSIYSLTDAYYKYHDYVEHLDKRKIKIGIPVLDNFMRGIAPGEACQIMARAGVGKTALMLNILSNAVIDQKVSSLVFSLEMPVAQMFERMVQISNARSGREVEKVWREDQDTAEKWFSNTVMNFGTSCIVDKDFLTTDEIYEYYVQAEKKFGKKPTFVCLDYLGRMKGNSYNIYESTSELAREMKNMAKELDVALIFLHQTSRAGGDGSKEITMEMARDSGVIEEAADFMIGLWRPHKNTEEAKSATTEKMRVSLLKNRKGPVGATDMMFHKKSLIIDTEEGLRQRGIE